MQKGSIYGVAIARLKRQQLRQLARDNFEEATSKKEVTRANLPVGTCESQRVRGTCERQLDTDNFEETTSKRPSTCERQLQRANLREGGVNFRVTFRATVTYTCRNKFTFDTYYYTLCHLEVVIIGWPCQITVMKI